MSKVRRTRGLFITGTDTGVGKTMVTGGIAAILRKEGFHVGVMKPVETGCSEKNGILIPADGQFLRDMAEENLPLDLITPYRLKAPLAPSVAAELEGIKIDIDQVVKIFEHLSNQREFTLVEGAGGLLVPISGEFLFLDLIKRLQLPTLIISRANLGTINHTLLTVRAAQAKNIEVVGIVINNLSPERSLAEETNPKVIARLTTVPLWGIIPYQAELKPQSPFQESIIKLIREHLNLIPLYSLMRN